MLQVGLAMGSDSDSPQRSSWRLRHSARRGNSLVEFSLCFLPLFALFLGIADVSFAVFLRSMIESAVRDGVRFAITYSVTLPDSNCNSMTTCITAVVQRNSLGFLDSQARAELIDVNYYQPTDLSSPITSADCDPNGSKFMQNDPQNPPRALRWVNQPGNLIEVRISDFPWNWMAPIPGYWSTNAVLMSASATDVLQGLPAGALTPPSP
ncbi:MAG: TadE/TadG family type IV pilus assembly protein [Acidobacteriota bacterium]|jgi:hypothetical protein